MPSVLKSIASRRDSARRKRRMWLLINNSTSSMRNELIEMRDRQQSGQDRGTRRHG